MTKKIGIFVIFIFSILLSGCSHEMDDENEFNEPIPTPIHSIKNNYYSTQSQHFSSASKNASARGMASWYGRRFNRKRTTSGERYNMYKLTAAHKTLPFNTYVEVTNLLNGKKVVVKINDRGPFTHHRLIDLSYAAAKELKMLGRGVAPVRLRVIT